KYEQLADVDMRARRGVVQAAGLLAIRERDLGLPDLHYLDRARQNDPDPGDAVLFEIVGTLPRRLSSRAAAADDAQLEAMIRARRNRDAWRAALKEREGALAMVTTLAYECRFGDNSDLAFDQLLDRNHELADTPLVRFTTAICRGAKTTQLGSMLAADPRFVEINYFLGQSASRHDLEEADRR